MKRCYKIIPLCLILLELFLPCKGQVDRTENKETLPVYTKVEVMPSFSGGGDSLAHFIENKINFAQGVLKEEHAGTVQAIFVIDTLGVTHDVTIIYASTPELGLKLKSILEVMPNWTPGRHNGRKVQCEMHSPLIRLLTTNKIFLDSSNVSNKRLKEKTDTLSDQKSISLFFNYIFNYYYEYYYKDWKPFAEANHELSDKNYNKALEKFNVSLISVPYDPFCLMGRGTTYYEMGDVYNACIDWRYALYLNDKLPDTLIHFLPTCSKIHDIVKFRSDGFVVPSENRKVNSVDIECDQDPEFPEGIDSLYEFLATNFDYNRFGIASDYISRVLIRFKITKDGEIKNPELVRSLVTIHPLIEQEAIRLAMKIPKWKPAIKNGLPISVDYIFPILNFQYKKKLYLRQSQAVYDKALDLFNKGEWVEAIYAFNNTIKLRFNTADSYYNRGVCHYKIHELENACEDWSDALYHWQEARSIKALDKFCDSSLIFRKDNYTQPDTFSTSVVKILFDSIIYSSRSNPSFYGGTSELNRYLKKKIMLPQGYESYTGRVEVCVIIRKTGEIIHPFIVKGDNEKVNDLIIDVVNKMPKWVAGTIDDIPQDMMIDFYVPFSKE